MEDKVDKRIWNGNKPQTTYKSCIDCGTTFTDTFKYSARGRCVKCGNDFYRKKRKETDNNFGYVYKRKYNEYQAYVWINDMYRKNLWVGMVDLSDMIEVYMCLGGSTDNLNKYRMGVQLEKMWRYCSEWYQNRNK